MTMGPSSLRTALLSSLALWLITGIAEGQARAAIELTDCPGELGAAVEAALDVELSMTSPDAQRGLGDGTLRCALVCDASATTAVVFRGGDRLEQRVERDGAGLARRLAIALAELLDAASAAPAPTSEPEPATTPEPEPAPPDDTAAERLEVRLRVAGGAWLGGEPLLALGTIELGVELAPISNVALVLGVAGTLGAIELEDVRLDVGLLSGSVSLRFGGEVGALWLGGGPALRGGVVRWVGTPDDATRAVGRELVGGWLGLGAVAAALLRLDDLPLRVGLEAEGGGIAFESGALVLGALGARIGGGWIELRAAIDLQIE